MPLENRPPSADEGGLHAPTGLGFWRTAWWWFDFLILVNLARFRFILILAAIGIVIAMWGTMTAYYDKWTRPAGAHASGSGDTEYFCPMHPTVVRDNPKEKCPICYMPLSRRKKGEAKDEALPPGIVNRVQLSPYRVVLAGIETTKVGHVPLRKDLVAVGSVEFDERELKHVAARVKARIDRLYVNETGQWVTKNQPLASLYSPDLIVTVQNLIDANRARNTSLEDSTRERLRLWGINDKQIDLLIAVQNLLDGTRKNDKALRELAEQQMRKLDDGVALTKGLLQLLEGQRTDDAKIIAEARQQLVKLDLHEDQLDDILETGKAIRHLIIRAPIKGHVLKKFVKEGQYVDEGSPLYDVVDLNTVWIQAQVYEEDMAFLPTFHHPLKAGEELDKALPVTATTRASATEVFKGRLAFVTPHVDPETRTVVARFELDNPGHKLRPGTSANVTFQIPPRRVAVIGDALARRWAEQAALFASDATALASLIHAAGDHALLHQGLVLAIPETAVIDTGSQRIVYREIAPGEYEGVRVELGPRMTGPNDAAYFPVLRGLQAGDMVVKAGAFLVDAETRLNPAAGSIYFGGSGSKAGAASSVRPSTPADEEAKISASLAKLNDADRRLANAQVFCPIIDGSRLGSMGVPTKVTIDGVPVLLCCKGCNAKAMANPQKTLAAVKELKVKGTQK